MMIKDFKENEKFNGHLMVNNFTKGVSNNGQPYLNITFQDASGTIEGKKWEINDKDLELVKIGEIIYVNAEILKYREKNQLKVLTLSEQKGEINLAEYIKSAPIEQEVMLSKLFSYIDLIEYDDVKKIVITIENNLFAFTSFSVSSLFGCLIGANTIIVIMVMRSHIMVQINK